MILKLKNRYKMKIKILFFYFLFAIPLFCQEVIDKVVAIVDNEIIMQSELQFQVNLAASQRKISIDTPGLKNQVLKAMIEDKLVYAQANIDSITVTDEEVENRINYQIQMFTQQYGRSEEHTSELQSLRHLVCRLLLEKKKNS